jgi:hypothetical protein
MINTKWHTHQATGPSISPIHSPHRLAIQWFALFQSMLAAPPSNRVSMDADAWAREQRRLKGSICTSIMAKQTEESAPRSGSGVRVSRDKTWIWLVCFESTVAPSPKHFFCGPPQCCGDASPASVKLRRVSVILELRSHLGLQYASSVPGWQPARSRFGRYCAIHATHLLGSDLVSLLPQSACNKLSHIPPGNGVAGTGGVGRCIGQSVRGSFSVNNSWKDPAHASRSVRNPGFGPKAKSLSRLRLKRFVIVAEMLECSNCEVLVGPVGSCGQVNTDQTSTSNKIMQPKQQIRCCLILNLQL